MIFFNKILALSKQLAKSVLNGEKLDVLEDIDFLKKQDKTYVNDQLSNPKKISDRNYLLNKIDKKKDWVKLQSKLSPRNEKPVYKLDFIKFAAAAVIILSIGFYFFNNVSDFNSKSVTKSIVHVPINPGTDKATLVLGSGQTIVLGHGHKFQANGIVTNDTQISYSDNDKKEIEFNYLTIPRGGQFFLELEDETKVWINSQSQLKFPNKFIDGKPRVVELLYGEAYFEVSPSSKHKGSHFNVIAKGQNVEVLGTQFNINAYDDEVNVYTTLVEGKVELSNAHKSIALIPNQQAILNKLTNTVQTKTVDVYNYISWKEGIFSFQNLPLKEIMKVLSRWYDVDVVFKDKSIENKGFNGSLGKEQKLEAILQTIKEFGIIKKYEVIDNQVILK